MFFPKKCKEKKRKKILQENTNKKNDKYIKCKMIKISSIKRKQI
jgi:hypothetical protein